MGTHPHITRGAAHALSFDQLAAMLGVIPSLPRPVLARLTERLLESLDEIDGDPDYQCQRHWRRLVGSVALSALGLGCSE